MEERMERYKTIHQGSIATITLHQIPQKPGIGAKIFDILSKNNINVKLVFHTFYKNDVSDLTLAVDKANLDISFKLLESLKEDIKVDKIDCKKNLVIISIHYISGKMKMRAFATDVFRSITNAQCDIDMLSISHSTISCIIPESKVKDVIFSLERRFKDEVAVHPI